MVQDNWRYIFFASRRGGQAFLNDVVWALVMFPLVGVFIASGLDSIAYFTLAWAGAGCIAGIVGSAQGRAIPKPLRAGSWWRSHRDLINGLFGDFAAMTGLSRVSVYFVALVAGLKATAAIRGANVLLGPVNVVFQGVPPIALPEAVRLRHHRNNRLFVVMGVLSGGLAIAAIVLGSAVLLLPDAVGRILLHNTWTVTKPVVLPATFMLAASAVNTGPIIGLRALEESTLLFRTRLVAGPITVIGAVVGAALAGAVGAMIGNGIATSVADILWWRCFKGAVNRRRKEAFADAEGGITSPMHAPTATATQREATDKG
jgi:hypothetical protein